MASNASTETISNSITTDHREIYAYYDKYVENAGNIDAQTRWANQLTWEVARHSIGEELVVYPLLEKHLGAKGKQMADEDRNAHQYIKDGLAKIEKLTPGSQEHAALLKDIIDHLKAHANEEETRDLPALEKAISVDDSISASKSFSRTKNFVPTRSHPNAPNKPPFETLVGFMAAPIDKLKDAFSKFPSAEEREKVSQAVN